MHFTVYKDHANGWRWTLFAANNRKIADSGEAYVERAGALWGIGLVVGTNSQTPIKEG
jgi:uncharacterized protein